MEIATEIPSEQLLRISMCPQYESRAVSKHYTYQLNLTRILLTATMRKSNVDSHYNHKLNQLGNSFVLELNNMVYKHLNKESEKPHQKNDIIFSVGIAKIIVDDKTGIPIGEPGQPIRTNVQNLTA